MEDGPLDTNFEKFVKDHLDLWHVPGVSVAVVDGENIWTAVYTKSLQLSHSHFNTP